ncbi:MULTISPECIES: hypothetical protein [unclassified Tolypothrix]|uniref:hypothetical protein n=1 Tax=unclassified Tolypothrix TaxID=2649714 RepID=UPI0005EAA652|nr:MULTISPECIES: hypothetical protein [unclassified Tolypothrix]EKF05786.1 bromodomain containing 4 [Tolypothrix sp. PCC 7601]UYD37521.1 hypothetical protein HG267_18460 [Tolypothrix sp. PCC 7601]
MCSFTERIIGIRIWLTDNSQQLRGQVFLPITHYPLPITHYPNPQSPVPSPPQGMKPQ